MSVPPRFGVCSWSLHPRSGVELAERVKALNIARIGVQLALEPLRSGAWGEMETVRALRDAGIPVLSGMMQMLGEDYSTLESIARTGGVRPDHTWEHNRAAAGENARIARRLGLKLVTFHAGFIPHEDSAERCKMLGRLREVIDIFEQERVRVAFETGQESAQTLLHALDELARPHAGVNFDPANMILYGMGDPCAALELLAPRVAQVHIKDAVPSAQPGQWGREVPAGEGAVSWARFFDALEAGSLAVDLVIEREAGERRGEDIARAAALVAQRGRMPHDLPSRSA